METESRKNSSILAKKIMSNLMNQIKCMDCGKEMMVYESLYHSFLTKHKFVDTQIKQYTQEGIKKYKNVLLKLAKE